MVLALLAKLSGFGGDDGGAWTVGGSRYHLALGPALCAPFEPARAPRAPASESFLARRWDVRSGRRQLDVPQPSTGLCGRHDRFHAIPQAGSDCSQAVPALGVVRNRRDPAASDQCEWTPSICSSHRRVEAIWGFRSALSLSAITLLKQHHGAGPQIHKEAHRGESWFPVGRRGGRSPVRRQCM